MKRRRFIQAVAAGLAGASTVACAREKSPALVGKPSGRPRVAVFADPQLRGSDGAIDGARLPALLEAALCASLGCSNAAKGLSRLFRPDDTVGVKLNCLAGPPLSPRPELCQALAGLLEKAGVPAEQIIFFERAERDLRKGGFETRYSDGPLFLGNDSPNAGYEDEPTISGQVGSCLSRILTRRISALISLGVLKDHNLAGVSGCMKNLYGLIHNPNKYHDSACDPYVADVLAFPDVQKRLRLSVLDATTAQCHGGPGYLPGHAWPLNSLLASTDPVALDAVAWDILEERRKETKLPPLQAEKREPGWLRTAAARSLGVAESKGIDVIRRD